MPLNPGAAPFYPRGLNPHAAPFYPRGLNPNAPPYRPSETARNMAMALRAGDYVRTVCGIRSNNHPSDSGARADVPAARMEGFQRMAAAPAGWKAELSAMVSAYTALRAGNCDEMAKVAFDYLARNGARPIEILCFALPLASRRGAAEEDMPDHTIVVIGRRISGAEQREKAGGGLDVPDVSTWNAEAVICDPWASRAYSKDRLQAASQEIKQWTQGSATLTWDSPYRLEVGDAWPG